MKRERELREVTLEEITSATRIGARYLEALENEDWAKLPGGVFNRGFVRSVARYLGLDEEALLSEYDLAHGTQVPVANEHPVEKVPSGPRWLPAAALVGVLVLLAGFIAGGIYTWKYFARRRGAKQSQVSITPARPAAQVLPPPAEPAALPSSVVVPPLRAALDLSVFATAATHLRIQADGKLVFNSTCRPAKTVPSHQAVQGQRDGLQRGVAGIERAEHASAWPSRQVRYNEVEP
ncbi:MAG: helix-turn-helix transcriptional regulator [Candidatus Acidiferrum sp.]